jgi:hypothetical protein
MNWPSVVKPEFALLYLLLVPLVLFYFLKLKRPRVDIPSLALWRSVLNDQRVNSPFQKFKRNLLLLLQVLLLTSLATAAMRPFMPSGAERAIYLPILVDCSASMAALDLEQKRSRLAAAQEEVGKLIDNMLPDQRLAIIAVSNSARRMCDFTDNKRVLREALARIEVDHVASRLEDALRMTQALARTYPISTAILFTDGNVPDLVDFDLPFQLNFQRLPEAGPNIGITAVSAQRRRDRWEVFARVEGSKSTSLTAAIELSRNGQKEGEEIFSIEEGKSERILFHVDASEQAAIELRLRAESFDALDLDNVAHLDLPRTRDLLVYCALDLGSFRRALSAFPDVLMYPDDEGNGSAASYDLVISDKREHLALASGAAFFTGFVPEELKTLVKIDETLAEVVDWQRGAPLLQYVMLTETQFAEQPVAAKGSGDREFEELGYATLAHAKQGPLVLHKDVGGRQMYFLLCHVDRSTLPYRVGFPVLAKNLLDIARKAAGLADVRGLPAGLLPVGALKPATEYEIAAPDGARYAATTDDEGHFAAVAAPKVGRYLVREGSSVAANVGVNLQSASETTLAAVEALQFKEQAVGAAATALKTDHPLWPWLAGFGFLFLVIEWWYFQKRPSGMPG